MTEVSRDCNWFKDYEHDPVVDVITKELLGIEFATTLEQGRMIKQAAQAGAQALRDACNSVVVQLEGH